MSALLDLCQENAYWRSDKEINIERPCVTVLAQSSPMTHNQIK
jgi:hypothetical protein